jgi:hypothetical protein
VVFEIRLDNFASFLVRLLFFSLHFELMRDRDVDHRDHDAQLVLVPDGVYLDTKDVSLGLSGAVVHVTAVKVYVLKYPLCEMLLFTDNLAKTYSRSFPRHVFNHGLKIELLDCEHCFVKPNSCIIRDNFRLGF